MSRYIPGLGWTSPQRRQPLAITADDVNDIKTVAQAAMDATAIAGFTPEVTVTHVRGGAIVNVKDTHQVYPAGVLRQTLQQMGYVVSREDLGRAAVTVTGRNPDHAWSEVST
ncbi:hypothetical protein [Nonomuraea roseoviolacea]|uniref:Heavy-metal-associated domain-containing protein n=1 Tax=Nonomuraea roseoviolacea subsp. carminata TaxID=160689 RepID=A0ABT1KC72_9ACTN|nr:hypothetical protein [Nonomuraea roseoviolacea]MCP2350584.1 hypothetical protein [Nonomuraea roseoviolacea subsp. carminata]